ncbi:preprotein translocase subunit YajC [Fructilactobacillus vespulae]|uniref:preprotein translocase subunit YajC n=1 Tax=Fructilactobacillus vespulae TaxID=1249630 RepID=UPI0039B3D78E
MQQYGSILVLIILFGLMYLFMIRPQKKQQQKHQETLKNLAKGDEVTTIGRLHGKVDDIDRTNGVVTLDCDGVYLTFDLTAIASVKSSATAKTEAPVEKETTEAPADDSAKESDDK